MTRSIRPWVAVYAAAFATLLAAGCADTPKTAIRLIMELPTGTQVDQIHVVGTVEGAPLLTLDVPKKVDGALQANPDVVLWVADAVAGKNVDFTIAGNYQSALVAQGEAGLVPKLHKTLRLTMQLTAATPCPTGQLNCAGTCADPSSDRSHCGRCDVACSPNQVCRSGACANNPCSTGQHECSGSCYLDTDVLHCGPTCSACPVPASHGTASCSNDECQINCDGGFVKCPGACVDVNTDPNNCGICGHQCGSAQVCRNSSCTAGLAPQDSPDGADGAGLDEAEEAVQ